MLKIQASSGSLAQSSLGAAEVLLVLPLKMEACQFKINLHFVPERPVLKRISILWGLKAKGTVFFSSFSPNTGFLALGKVSPCSPFLMPVPWREKSPSTSNVQATVLGGLRTGAHGWESCST